MASDWKDDVRELIEALSERLNLHVMNRSMMVGAGIGVVSAGLGMCFGPVGLVAGTSHIFRENRTVDVCFFHTV